MTHTTRIGAPFLLFNGEPMQDEGLINHYYWYERVAEKGPDAVKARIHFLNSDDPGALVNVAGAGTLADESRVLRRPAGRERLARHEPPVEDRPDEDLGDPLHSRVDEGR